MPAAPQPLIIVNPTANRGRTAALLPALISAATARGAEVLETCAPGDGTRLAADAARRGHSPIVAVGGDGTIHEVASGILESHCDVPLGLVPAGSGNDFALGIAHVPLQLEEALTVALGGRPKRMDVARLNDGWLLNAFGAGIDANAAWDARDLATRRGWPVRGQMLYTIAALRQLVFHYQRLPHLDITFDGETVAQGPTLLAAVMVGPRTGGGYHLTPGARADDGLLDMCVSRRMPRLKALVALLLAKQGRHTGLREVRMLRGRVVRIRSSRAIQIHVDGELQTGHTFDIRIEASALQVMVPSNTPA